MYLVTGWNFTMLLSTILTSAQTLKPNVSCKIGANSFGGETNPELL